MPIFVVFTLIFTFVYTIPKNKNHENMLSAWFFRNRNHANHVISWVLEKQKY
jgi:hypothetical protein